MHDGTAARTVCQSRPAQKFLNLEKKNRLKEKSQMSLKFADRVHVTNM